MKTKTMYKNAEGEIRVVQIFFGNEVFELRYNKERNFWMMWRKEKNPIPFTTGMWLLNVTFDSLKEAKKFIKDRKYYATRLITIDQLDKQ